MKTLGQKRIPMRITFVKSNNAGQQNEFGERGGKLCSAWEQTRRGGRHRARRDDDDDVDDGSIFTRHNKICSPLPRALTLSSRRRHSSAPPPASLPTSQPASQPTSTSAGWAGSSRSSPRAVLWAGWRLLNPAGRREQRHDAGESQSPCPPPPKL